VTSGVLGAGVGFMGVELARGGQCDRQQEYAERSYNHGHVISVPQTGDGDIGRIIRELGCVATISVIAHQMGL